MSTIDLSAVNHYPPIVESGLPDRAPLPPARCELLWESEEDTRAFAVELASLPLTRNAFFALYGDLGAGKTTLVRHLLRALGVQGRIKSPTYAVVESYEVPGLAIWHFDFYRFNEPREWEEAGFRDIFSSPGLKVAEWPQKALGVLPPADLEIHLQALGESQRSVQLLAHTRSGAEALLRWGGHA